MVLTLVCWKFPFAEMEGFTFCNIEGHVPVHTPLEETVEVMLKNNRRQVRDHSSTQDWLRKNEFVTHFVRKCLETRENKKTEMWF